MDLHILRVRQGLYVIVPVPLVFGDVILQSGRQVPVESLGLTVSLQMIGRGEHVQNSEKAAYSFEEFGCKLGSFVGQQCSRHTITVYPRVEECLSHLMSFRRPKGYSTAQLGKAVRDDQYVAVPVRGFWQGSIQVHGDKFQRPCGGKQRLLLLLIVLRAPHASARPAVGDRLLDVRGHMRPAVQTPHCLVHLARAEVSL